MNDTVLKWLESASPANIPSLSNSTDGWPSDPKMLISSSSVHDFSLGTGCSIYSNVILPNIAAANFEVILVTCFWARSPTLDGLNHSLRALSAKSRHKQRIIKVRICFSSTSLFQKLFHTRSLEGRTYAASEWPTKLGLPPPEELTGLDLEVKSIFVRPFSVMHPKFIILDRSKVYLPSCNVSWEDWFEGCVQLSGPITEQFFGFWKTFWASDRDRELAGVTPADPATCIPTEISGPGLLSSQILDLKETPSAFLLSPHNPNPNFALLPWQSHPPARPTPLNTFLQTAFDNAKREIYIQTPNLTSPPVLSALLDALQRGVDVTIVTSERLMILEQLVTAGTTTKRCIKALNERHKSLIRRWTAARSNHLESGMLVAPGTLCVRFYRADKHASGADAEPVQSHLKLTVIDGEITILGSGNMDRASWYTSQELGVALVSKQFATGVMTQVNTSMRERTRKWSGDNQLLKLRIVSIPLLVYRAIFPASFQSPHE